ncbi:MAG: hypothetical protein GY696_38040, partial [Gammaproteobacteria bacterium]|nr:hypothetical protein [Gammaproteobacteria bacterium]
ALSRDHDQQEKDRVYINVPRTVPIVDDFDDDNILPDGISDSARYAYFGEYHTLNALKESDKTDWARETREDPYYGRIVRFIQEGNPYLDTLDQEERYEVLRITPHCELSDDGVLFQFYQRKEYLSTLKLICVPETLRYLVYHQFHDSPVGGGHVHGKGAYETARVYFTWPTMQYDIMRYCKSCLVCLKTNTNPRKRQTALTPQKMQHVFQRVAVDIAGPFKPSKGKRYLLIVVDFYTKY